MLAIYQVDSHSQMLTTYNVRVNRATGQAYDCSCPHFKHRLRGRKGARCKHMAEAEKAHARVRYAEAARAARAAGLVANAADFKAAFEARRDATDLTVAIDETFALADLLRQGRLEEARNLFTKMLWGD